ncbi:hypothetical protein GXM_02675 [Nostoc sphaeroides CCNUC1]|uniref:Uncharacterized protein n=1 Tax=Nostoc sphaeroides CCNUC1 TaxID=2653204 RepID=A0A5P8VXR2_9NOSO|nr:hypothetical protein GXM_02675 [Nostoc sphaeroides CCNUC1]
MFYPVSVCLNRAYCTDLRTAKSPQTPNRLLGKIPLFRSILGILSCS